MNQEVEKIIQSGLLESYVLGTASEEEARQIAAWIQSSDRIRIELERLQEKLEHHTLAQAVHPPARVKKRLFDVLADEFRETKLSQPYPDLKEEQDLAFWQKAVSHIQAPESYDNLFMYDLNDPYLHTQLVWVQNHIPPETHHNIHERFFILAGSCTCTLGDGRVIHLKKGDYMEIPLHISHDFQITSRKVAQFILQWEAVA